MSEAALFVEGLSKAYGGKQVLRELDLRLEPGDVVALVGPNGAGKSTLLGCVCGTVLPDQGRIRIGGVDLANEPVRARAQLRYLAQESDLPEGLTGLELLRFHAEVFGAAGDLEQGKAFAELGESLEHLATTYSVGMRRRLALACLLPGRPALFVLDEPFAGLDADARLRATALLEKRVAKGAALLLAAHASDQTELERLGAKTFPLGDQW